jgi:hypothetical protein
VKTYRAHGLSLGHHWGQVSMGLMALVVLAAAFFYSPTKGLASDHRDSPTADANGEGDITDIFAFLDPNDVSQLVFIMDVNPFAVPAETPSYRFSPNFLYQFKIANDKQAKPSESTGPPAHKLLALGTSFWKTRQAWKAAPGKHSSKATCKCSLVCVTTRLLPTWAS